MRKRQQYCRREDKDQTCSYLENTIKISLAGKAVTELVYGEADEGCNSDLHNAFSNASILADNLCVYGFHNWIEDSNTSFVAENRNRSMTMILERNYLEVKKIIVENRDLLEELVTELMNKRTLISSDVQKVFSKDNRKTI